VSAAGRIFASAPVSRRLPGWRVRRRERRSATVVLVAPGGLTRFPFWRPPTPDPALKWRSTMRDLMVDFITSLDGYASAEGWPGWWGLEGPEYLAWLEEQPEVTYLMGANTYRLMSGFATGVTPAGTDEFRAEEEASLGGLTSASKVVFSSSLEEPLSWSNSTLVRGDAADAVRAMKEYGSGLLSTIGSVSLCRSLLRAGLVDRFRVVIFPVITGATGAERIYDGYPDVALDMIDHRTFDGRIQLVEYRPRVLEHPPGSGTT
jgi:dihydrofolate reductase